MVVNLILELEHEYEDGMSESECDFIERYYSQFDNASAVFFQDEYGIEEQQDF